MGHKGMIGGAVALLALLVVSRGGAPKASQSGGLDPAASPMKGAVYAVAIPVFENARLRDMMGGNYYDEVGGAATFTSTSWFFELKAPVAEVAEFYRKNLPAGWKPGEAEAGEVAFEWIPPGAKQGEDVTVTIRDGELQISETVTATKG